MRKRKRDGRSYKSRAAGDAEPNPGLVEKGAEAVELLVWGVPARNPRLVVAYVDGVDPLNPLNLVAVMVRENQYFTRGMKLPGPGRALIKSGPAVYVLQGACPRWRGKW